MGQYHKTVNLTKREFLMPHDLGNGLKLWEQLNGGPGGIQDALTILLAVSNGRGGGDFGENDPDDIVGRWGGDRVAIIGDYAEDSDIKDYPVPASEIYGLCVDAEDVASGDLSADDLSKAFTDITPLVCAYLERLYDGRYVGSGWKQFISKDSKVWRWKGISPNHYRQTGKVEEIASATITVAWNNDETRIYSIANPEEYFATC
ncbi:hypothetical protein [Bradyrhizobium sp. Tv2a-2]|uniref:hypothetical protein n=1 Tax=Bradyrhizobium sp. Tv2a-2 TaxID=113395 RepID=UPI0004651E63|nr:hypothetical protein [Bradyrhizobium sp. Tv2a-2]